MIKCLTSGGLGDALMSIAKLHSKDAPFKITDDIHVTHVEIPDKLLSSIDELYSTQGIKHEVIKIDSDAWIKEHIDDYDFYLGTSWSERNAHQASWKIEPFPTIVHNTYVEYDLIIAPFAGRESERWFSISDMNKLLSTNLNVTLIGWCPDLYKRKFPSSITGYLNNTTIQEVIDLVGSCSKYIGHHGFLTYLACMMRKEVYCAKCSELNYNYYFHPDWGVTFIK